MLTKRMRVRPAFPDDWLTIADIAKENGRHDFLWPMDAWGVLAILNDVTVAFAAARNVNGGILVEELWARNDPDGVRGLSALSEWIENTAQTEAHKIQYPFNVGGVVFPKNKRHRDALIRRGYSHHADIYAKEFTP